VAKPGEENLNEVGSNSGLMRKPRIKETKKSYDATDAKRKETKEKKTNGGGLALLLDKLKSKKEDKRGSYFELPYACREKGI